MRRLLALIMLLGCSSSTPPSTPPATTDAATIDPNEVVFGGDRPVNYFKVAEGHDPKSPLPLVMVLHGYGASGFAQAGFFRLEKLALAGKFILVAPDGTPRKDDSRRFWNAVDTCCDFEKTGVDDVKYLTGLVDEIAAVWAIDKKRVYLVGHSNGGAMSYRLGCDAAAKFAAIVTLAPPFYSDLTKCKPSEPVAIRHLHGTADETVPYQSGPLSVGGGLVAPGARKSAEAWAAWNGCSATPDESAAPIEFDGKVPGAETKIAKYTGCKPNGDVELWSLEGTSHIPFELSPELPNSIWSFFEAHPKP